MQCLANFFLFNLFPIINVQNNCGHVKCLNLFFDKNRRLNKKKAPEEGHGFV